MRMRVLLNYYLQSHSKERKSILRPPTGSYACLGITLCSLMGVHPTAGGRLVYKNYVKKLQGLNGKYRQIT